MLWQHTRPSLRRLVAWVSTAAALAMIMGQEWVTIDQIGDAAELIRFGAQRQQEIEPAKGIHERISELRNAYKALKRRAKK